MPGPGCNTDIKNALPQEKSGPYGVQTTFPIPVMTGNRKVVRLVRNKKGSVKSTNLLNIECQPRNAPVSPVVSTRLALLNIRSLANKSLLVNDMIMTYNLDFLFLSETWLTEYNCNAILNEAAPTNFSFINKCRGGKKGGGVAVIFKSVFQCKEILFGDFSSFEYLCFLVKGDPKVIFLIIYRPPRYPGTFFDEFAELLSVICTDYNFFIIKGDFNIHMDNNMDTNAKELCSLLDTFGLFQHVNGPTHTRGHTLDLVISKGVDISSVDIKDLALSDHYCVFSDLQITPNSQLTPVSVRKRYINENTSAKFMEVIALSSTVSAETVDELLENFNSKISNVMDTIAPVKTKMILSRKRTPWRNTMMVKALKTECRKAERKWRKTKLQIHHDLYKQSLCNFNHGLLKARQQYLSEMINKNINSTRALFAMVDKLTTPPKEIVSELCSTEKCNEFACFFNDKIKSIRLNINTNQQNNKMPQSLKPPRNQSTMMSDFNTVDQKTIEETVRHLKPSTYCLDTMPSDFFKTIVSSVQTDLQQIINCSLRSGTFPKSLKVAAIKPLLKKRTLDASILINYRPISNLPFIAKIVEKVVFNQLSNFLNSSGLFDKFQSGFRPHHSTETALIRVLNDIRLNTDSGRVSVLVLLDLSAAFDTVDHSIMLNRLETWAGLSGTVLDWFRSYLEERSYFVTIGSNQSDQVAMTCGVPQGSVLGPLLFSLYMLPLGQILQNSKVNYHSYADDTQIYLALSPDDCSPIESLCDCLEQVKEWMNQNFLQLNEEKTEVIVFGNKEKRVAVSKHLESLALETKDQVRNLGVLIDSDLTFNNHIKSVTKSAFYQLKNISRIKGFMSQTDQEKLIHAFISNRLDYCNGLLTGLPQKSIKQLQLIQNAAARVLTRTKRSEHITPVLKSLHWLPVRYRIDFKVLLLVYKSCNGLGPEYMNDMLVEYKPSRALRSTDSGQIVEPRVQTRHGEAAFSYYAAHNWNKLPAELKSAPTLSTFKSRLKTFLFRCAYG